MLSEFTNFTKLGLFGIRAYRSHNSDNHWFYNDLPFYTTEYLCHNGGNGKGARWDRLFSGNCVADDGQIDPFDNEEIREKARLELFGDPMNIFAGYGEIDDNSDRLYDEYVDSSAKMYQETRNLQP